MKRGTGVVTPKGASCKISITTIHGAKGLEADIVILIND